MSGAAPRPDRPVLARPMVVAGLAIAGVMLVGGAALFMRGRPAAIPQTDSRSPAPAAALAPSTPGTQPAPIVSSTGTGPKFDIARIAPDGNAVIAGRAQPGATVTVLDGDQPIGETQADARGAFVFLPARPLSPGARALRLREQAADGTQTQGTEEVVLVVPPRAGDGTRGAAMALLTSPNDTPRLLQTPLTATGPVEATSGSRLGLDLVDYDEAGDIRFSGTALAGAELRIYVDNQPLGLVHADTAGRWSFQAPGHVAAGDHQLRLDQLGATGQVGARVELPFRREARLTLQAAAQTAPAPATSGGELTAGERTAGQTGAGGRVVVQPGNSLWLLARQNYGEGLRYTAIYAANRAQIRDPDLIYPGQLLAMPAQAGSSTASSSSRSR